MKFDFQFGKKQTTRKQIIQVSIIVSLVITLLSQCTGVSENGLWDLLDEIQRKYFPQGILNELILKDPEKLNRRIIRDVDKAIRDVTPEYDRIISDYDRKYQPKYLEEPNDETLCYTDDCKALAPPMRKCASWVEDCN